LGGGSADERGRLHLQRPARQVEDVAHLEVMQLTLDLVVRIASRKEVHPSALIVAL